MRTYVLMVIFNIVCMQQLKAAVVVKRPLPPKQELREHLLMVTSLPKVLCDMIITYMHVYVVEFDLTYRSSVLAASFSPDGTWIGTAGYGGAIYLWNAITQKEKLFIDHIDPVSALSFSPDTRLLATVGYSRDYAARIWCTGSRNRLAMLEGHRGILNAVSFNADGDHLVTASDDKTMRVWDVATGTSLSTLKQHAQPVCSAAFDISGNQVISASNDKTALMWDIRSDRVVRYFFGHQDDVNSASFSSDGQAIVTASNDTTVRIWNRDARLKGVLPIGKKVKSARFNADGQYIVTAGEGKVAYIWDANTRENIQQLDTDSKPVYAASFGPPVSEKIVTASNNRVLIWSVFKNEYKISY